MRIALFIILLLAAGLQSKRFEINVPLRKISRKKIVQIKRLNIYNKTRISLVFKKEFRTKNRYKSFDLALFGLRYRDYLALNLNKVENEHIKWDEDHQNDLENRELDCKRISEVALHTEKVVLYWDGVKTYEVDFEADLQGRRTESLMIMLGDCGNQTKIMPSTFGKVQIKLKTKSKETKNLEKNEMSLIVFLGLSILFCFYFIFANFGIFKSELTKDSLESSNSVFMWLYTSLIIKFSSTPLQAYHILHQYNGKPELPFVFFTSLLLSQLSKYIVNSVMIFLAHGLNVLHTDLEHFDDFVPICLLVGILDIFMVIVDFTITFDDSSHHVYDSSTMLVSILIQISLFGYFIKGIVSSLGRKASRKSSVRRYFRKLGLYGIFNYLSLPLLLYCCTLFPYEQQHFYVEIIRYSIQILLLVILLEFFKKKDGEYLKVAKLDITNQFE